jgi:hypothetical protein
MGDGMSSGFFKEETAKKIQNKIQKHCLGLVAYFYFGNY